MADSTQLEFMDFNPVPSVIDYNVGDEWIDFPHKLKNKALCPHTVQIHFDTNTNVTPRNLVIGVSCDAPGQILDLYFDGHHVGKEEIQVGSSWSEIIFWLGPIKQGSHKITITNNAPLNPDTGYGIFFDFLQLVPSDPNIIYIPGDYPSIAAGIQNAIPGDTIYVQKGEYKENISLKSGMNLMGEDPNGTVIDGDGKTVIVGAYQSQVHGLTIRNGGHRVFGNQGCGIEVYEDFMDLSNNIILSCAVGVYLGGLGLGLINNTLVQNDCGVYIQRLDANSPIPSLRCKNNIFSDSNCAIYLYTKMDNEYGIDPNHADQVVQEYRYNNIWTKFESNADLSGFGKGNIQEDPFFEDPNRGDYHLKSYSRCIDAGDPNTEFSQEPADNGQRVNMGAFGNTLWATKTLDSDGDGVRDYDEGPDDRDLNGIEDWADKQTSAFKSSAGNRKIWLSLKGDPNDSDGLKEVRAIMQDDSCISGFSLPSSYILYGFWGFRVDGLNYDSKIPVEIHFPQKLIESVEYITYDPNNGWETLSIRENPPSMIVSVELFDGYRGDMDRTKNGSVSHIGGIAVQSKIHEDLKSIDCFIECIEEGNADVSMFFK